MRNYQRTKDNPYLLPHNLYRRVLYLVRDYDRLFEEYNSVLHETPARDNMPRHGGIGDPTANRAIRREKIFSQMEAVDQGLWAIPREYRDGVLEHVKYGVRFPTYAHLNTWKVWQARFLYQVAKRLGEI